MKKLIKKMIIQSILENINEINLNISDVENTRTRNPQQIGFADSTYSSRLSHSSNSYEGEYFENEEDDDNTLDEFSGVGALGGGPVTPLGTDSKGKRVTKKDLKDQNLFNRKKSYPYNKKGKK